MSRKAIFVGINNYGDKGLNLNGCINDASSIRALLDTDSDGSPNFDTRLYTDVSTQSELNKLIVNLFSGESDIALFYFSGHGKRDDTDTYLVTPDYRYNQGQSLTQLLAIINNSRCKNKILILDCCFSGAMGNIKLGNGVTILTASREDEASVEYGGQGIFTSLLMDSLQGGAADIRGYISPASIYSYIDKSLGPFDQRPVFKTNITSFTHLRKVASKVTDGELRNLAKYFPSPDIQYPLDPSFEDTNDPSTNSNAVTPFANEKNISIFKILQKFQSIGLVEPVDAPFMYFAAMESKSCKLTALGYHYWRLVKEKRI
jgi:hypothetical protein